MPRLRVGIDLVQISRIAGSLDAFGERFLARVFTPAEVSYAGNVAERLAARFAAKEAAKKALDLDGVSWRDIEVRRGPSGALDLYLHGAARAAADALGTHDLTLSMSHEGDYATAIVVAQCEPVRRSVGAAEGGPEAEDRRTEQNEPVRRSVGAAEGGPEAEDRRTERNES